MLVRVALTLAFVTGAGPARAQDPPPGALPSLQVSGFVSAVSDYRFRGVSRSHGRFAGQAQVRLDTRSGAYAAAWGSSVAGYANADAEVDLYGGWTGTRGGWTPDVGVYGYFFPGGRGAEFYEVYGAVTHDLGPASATVGVNYAPDVGAGARALAGGRGRDSGYVYAGLGLAVPRTPVTLSAGAGYEDGALARAKTDWSLGATVRRGPLSAEVRYVDTDARGHDPTVAGRTRFTGSGAVFTLTADF